MYALVKIWVRVGLQFYCSRININKKNLYKGDAPLILACTHPNSFFDALVVGSYHHRKLHFLARGDAFKKPWADKILRMLNLIPIYRLSEGKEYVENNKHTFAECVDVFKKGGTVLIFSEGVSLNVWELQKLKKGTARLAWMCWKEFDMPDMVVQPIGINYHSFREIPRRIHVAHEQAFGSNEFKLTTAPELYRDFNEYLTDKLEPTSLAKEDNMLKPLKSSVVKKSVLAIPALLGYLIHRFPFVLWRKFIWLKVTDKVFFDSILFASLLLIYPIIVLLVSLAMVLITGNPLYWILFVILPFTAWSYKQYKAY